MKKNHLLFWMLAAVLVLGLVAQARAATVTATLDPAQISMGDSAQLTVTVSGAQDQPNVPQVDGLDITAVGQSTQIEIVNGSMTANASNTYTITPQHEGTFVIPAIHAGGAASQAVTLHVGAGSSPANATAPAQNLPPPNVGPVVQPPQASAQDPGDVTPAPEGRFGSIQVTLPKKEFFVGELVPVDIKAVIPEDVQASVTDLPQFTSDGFTLNSLSPKPEQSEQVINGRAYNVLTWHSALTGVKTGDYPLSLQMPLTVIVQQRMPQPADANDMFNNFFKNAFAGFGTKKEVTLKNSAETLKVLPLPGENRPADFNGAVGQFDIEASAAPTQVNVGDPITLKLKVTGTGNFDRVSSDMLASDAHWKTYSSKNHFDPSDSVGYQGTKTFEQPVIPNDASVTSVPSLTFSFFDPEKRQYVTRTATPIAVSVSGNPASPVNAPAVATTAQTSNQPTPAPAATPQPAAQDLRANQIDPGAFVATLRPIYLSPWFMAGQGLPLLALLAGIGFLRFRKSVAEPERVRATAVQQAIRQQVAAMDEAMRNQQTNAFFVHARSALQQRLGHQWNLRPETITLADVEARLGVETENIRPIFELADQASYSGLHFEESDLQQWRQVVLNELAEKN